MINLQFTPDWPVRCEFKFIGEAFQVSALAESRERSGLLRVCDAL